MLRRSPQPRSRLLRPDARATLRERTPRTRLNLLLASNIHSLIWALKSAGKANVRPGRNEKATSKPNHLSSSTPVCRDGILAAVGRNDLGFDSGVLGEQESRLVPSMSSMGLF